jgi:hypothetical protein
MANIFLESMPQSAIGLLPELAWLSLDHSPWSLLAWPS